MMTPARNQASDDPARQGYLIQFRVGGVRFAAEATTIASIASGDWKPRRSRVPGSSDRVVDMSALLNLPARPAQRTLVVETPGGLCGFPVDSISKHEIKLHDIRPVPLFLRHCMGHAVVSGFVSGEGRILSVLDLRRLAEEARPGGASIPKPDSEEP